MKQLIWIGSSHEDLKDFPPRICSAVGYALFQAQTGKRHAHAKTMSEMGNASMQEIRESDGAGTYRVVYKQVRLNIYKKFLALFAIFHAQLLGRVYRHCPRHFA